MLKHHQIHLINESELDININKLESVALGVCEKFCPDDQLTLDVLIAGDEQILEINKQFLNHDTKTDVISFDLTDDFEPGMVFELIVNAQLASREATSRGHDFEAEIALYIIHGLLHNFGFDDLEPELAKKMHAMEDQLLVEFGYGKIYGNDF